MTIEETIKATAKSFNLADEMCKRRLAKQKKELVEKIEKLPKYMENGQPIEENGRFIREEDVKELLT